MAEIVSPIFHHSNMATTS